MLVTQWALYSTKPYMVGQVRFKIQSPTLIWQQLIESGAAGLIQFLIDDEVAMQAYYGVLRLIFFLYRRPIS